MKKIIKLLFIIFTLFSGNKFINAIVAPKHVIIPDKFKNYFYTIKSKDAVIDGYSTGWLIVPGQGMVWVKFVGKSFYNSGLQPKDYTIEYIGRDDAGLPHRLPRGLYYWHDKKTFPSLEASYGHVRPAKSNQCANREFYYKIDVKTKKSHWETIFPANAPKIIWNPKFGHLHPSKEISHVFEKLWSK